MRLGQALSAWLAKITLDQNLEDIADLPKQTMTGKRRWWRRQDIGPTLNLGYYDTATGKFVLGTPDIAVTLTADDAPSQLDAEKLSITMDVDTTSQASYTLTAAAGKAYKVIAAGYSNSTRATKGTLAYNGDALSGGKTAGLATHVWVMLGECKGPNSNAVDFNNSIGGPIWLDTGDDLTITDDSFVAADNMYFYFLYEEYTV